ncbi:hypothetical protein QFZ38_004802 [Pseudomonas cedrina]|nr:hypothetical protein [Pseudomonas cedrina]
MTIRQPCPPGACVCDREQLLQSPGADLRILNLTRHEEKKLLERLEDLKNLQDLEHMQQRMYELLGIRVHIAPGHTEVKSMRGIQIVIDELPGMCRKTAPIHPGRDPSRPGETAGNCLPLAGCPRPVSRRLNQPASVSAWNSPWPIALAFCRCACAPPLSESSSNAEVTTFAPQ